MESAIESETLLCKNEKRDIEINYIKTEPECCNDWELEDRPEIVSDLNCVKKEDLSFPLTHQIQRAETEANSIKSIQDTDKRKICENCGDRTTKKCDICSIKTQCRCEFINHISTHKDPKHPDMYKCTMCDRNFRYLHRFKRHMPIHKKTPVLINCPVCECKYESREDYSSHILTHKVSTNPDIFQCVYCDHKTTRIYNMQTHLLVHKKPSEITWHKCHICYFKSKRKDTLKSHVRRHIRQENEIVQSMSSEDCAEMSGNFNQTLGDNVMESVDTESQTCKNEEYDMEIKDIVKIEPEYVNDWELKDQFENVSDADSVDEDDLSLSSSNQNKSDETETIQSTDVPDKVCENCGDCNTKECDICSFQAQCKCEFESHVFMHEDPNDPDMYKCTLCDQKFSYSKFKQHMSRHKNIRQLKTCPVCECKFKSRGDYNAHILTHKVSSNPDTYQCVLCDYKVTRIYNMSCHLLSHKNSSEIMLHKCDICNFKSKYKASLIQHVKRHFPQKNKNYKCDECSYETNKLDTFKRHQEVHKNVLERKQYKCTYCSNSYLHYFNLQQHLTQHNDESGKTLIRCDQCEYSTRYKSALERHMRGHMDGKRYKFTCDLCEYRTSSKIAYASHVKLCSTKKILESMNNEVRTETSGSVDQPQDGDKMESLMETETPSCKVEEQGIEIKDIVKIDPDYDNDWELKHQSEKVSDKDLVKKEELSLLSAYESQNDEVESKTIEPTQDSLHQNITNPAEKCMFCDQTFTDLKEFMAHVSTHTKPQNPLKCPVCECECETRYDYNNHISTHKVSSNPDMYQCVFCDHKTAHIRNMNRHLLLHKNPSEITWHKCDICNFRSKHSDSIKKHVVRHFPQENKSYKCDKCSYETNIFDTFRRHQLIHKTPLERKQYKCTLCPNSYSRYYRLQDHLMQHNDPSEVVVLHCDQCKYTTTSKGGYYKHIKRHNLREQFSCDLCDYKTSTQTDLTAHVDQCVTEKTVQPPSGEVCTETSGNNFFSGQLRQDDKMESMTESEALPWEDEEDIDIKDVVKIEPGWDNNWELEDGSCNGSDVDSTNKEVLSRPSTAQSKNGEIEANIESEQVTAKLKTCENCGDYSVNKCHICSFKAQCKCKFENHMWMHKNITDSSNMYNCTLCDLKFTDSKQFETHMSFHAKTQVKCPVCESMCETRDDYKNHILTHRVSLNPDMYQCIYCDHKVTRVDNMKRHLLLHKNSSEITWHKCEICDFKSKHSESLKKHMRRHFPQENKCYTCGICSYKATELRRLNEHKLIHTNPSERERYKCIYCPNSYMHSSSLRQHLRQHKDPPKRVQLRCDQCEYSTINKRVYSRHMKKHTDALKETSSKIDLTAHVGQCTTEKTVESVSGEASTEISENIGQCQDGVKIESVMKSETVYCNEDEEQNIVKIEPEYVHDWELIDLCGNASDKNVVKREDSSSSSTHQSQSDEIETNTTKLIQDPDKLEICENLLSDMKSHLQSDTAASEIIWHKCDNCSFKSRCRTSLQEHMALHLPQKDKSYKCDNCLYVTTRSSQLKRHKITHSKTSERKLYKCVHCPNSYLSHAALRRHLKQHKDRSERVLFRCDKCEYSTVYKGVHKMHIKTHLDTKKNQHGCNFCSYRTASKIALMVHVKQCSTMKDLQSVGSSIPSKNLDNETGGRLSRDNHSHLECCLCNVKFEYKNAFARHLLTHKDPTDLNCFKCSDCDFKSRYLGNFQLHWATRESLSAKQDHLDKFKNDTKLLIENDQDRSIHRSVTEKRKFKCIYCSKAYTTKGRLEYHMVQHQDPSEVALFRCDECDYSSTHKRLVRMHKKSHAKKTKMKV